MARWQPDARRRLVEAAVDLFGERGYDRTAVAEIAQRAGLTKTTFFRHFSDKREVLFAGQDEHCRLLADAVAAAPDPATPLEMTGAALDALAVTFPVERRAFSARVLDLVAASPELEERSGLKTAGYVAALAGALRRRGVPEPTALLAADMGVLAFTTAFAAWAHDPATGALAPLVRARLAEMHSAALALR